MEKIQIQFNESDYKVYYDYCQKYYQVHDDVRKQSVHAFLDLFEKGIIPVEPQDIRQASRFLAGKCDDLKKEHDSTGREDEPAMLWMRICQDLTFFCDDLEKIYRLIQKQGVSANYLMILGTFSRVIEETRNVPVAGMYTLDRETLESLARPLAGIIRQRLGTERDWHLVLRELTRIAARFNQLYPRPKFEMDILRLVAPTVVSHFQNDAEPRELLSVLPSYFEESELEEFEAFLDKAPGLSIDDTLSGVDWGTIYEPLERVTHAVAAQKDQWEKDRTTLSDRYSPATPAAALPTGDSSPPAGNVTPSSSGPQPESGYKTFDIAVGPYQPTETESPVKVSPLPDKPSLKSRMQPVIPIIIGVAVILVFIVGTMVVSGNLNLTGGNTTNQTIVKNATPAKPAVATKATTVKPTPVPNATTAKPSAVPNTTTAKPTATATPAPTPKSYSSLDIGNHLMEIAFGPDNNAIQKSQKDLIIISLSGTYDDSDIVLLNNFIGQFNNYSSTSQISTSIHYSSPGDIGLTFLPGEAMSQVKTVNSTSVYKDAPTGTYYFICTSDKTYVNADLTGNLRQRWILRAVLYNLGFLGETAKYPDSLFYAGTNNVTRLSDIDLKALQLMYGKKITNGMTKNNMKLLF